MMEPVPLAIAQTCRLMSLFTLNSDVFFTGPMTFNSNCHPVRRLRSSGFTLIELMVVLVIIGVLGALIVPSLLDRADDARVTAAKTDINNVMQALKLYKLDNQRYPSNEQGLEALVKKPTVGVVPPNWKPYVDKLPTDPWGKPYGYINPGVKGEIDVFSLGADGQQGGEGKNADIGSWQ
jgi:general secretion pathway protein G